MGDLGSDFDGSGATPGWLGFLLDSGICWGEGLVARCYEGFVGECRRLENVNSSFGECRRDNESWHLFLPFLLLCSLSFFSILSLQSRSCGALGSLFLEFGFSRMAASSTFRRGDLELVSQRRGL